MLVVVMGAGASFDSVGPRYLARANRVAGHWKPPLASELFDVRFGEIQRAFPDGLALVMRLQSAIERGGLVETEIQTISEEIGQDELGLRQLASVRFYLQELLWRCGEEWAGGAFGQTNQVALADAIERWRRVRNEEVTYITFNYDLMLERALSPFLPIGSFGDYVKGPTCLIKAHGSADLGASLRNPQPTYSG